MRSVLGLLLASACGAPPVYESPLLSFPLEDRGAVEVVIGVDADGSSEGDGLLSNSACTDFMGRGFPNCYNGHEGTDYTLSGGFAAMDAGSVSIIAAAAGTVVLARDGYYDRCRATIDGVDCDGNEMLANAVLLEHPSGIRTLYWHMKTGSVAVEVGQEVQAGDHLGLVGSSGISSLPHLHFGVELLDGRAIDPYGGPLTQEASLWCEQDAGDGLPGPC